MPTSWCILNVQEAGMCNHSQTSCRANAFQSRKTHLLAKYFHLSYTPHIAKKVWGYVEGAHNWESSKGHVALVWQAVKGRSIIKIAISALVIMASIQSLDICSSVPSRFTVIVNTEGWNWNRYKIASSSHKPCKVLCCLPSQMISSRPPKINCQVSRRFQLLLLLSPHPLLLPHPCCLPFWFVPPPAGTRYLGLLPHQAGSSAQSHGSDGSQSPD